jgi:hypothetical protein
VAARRQEPGSSWPGEVRSCSSYIIGREEVARLQSRGKSQAPPGQERQGAVPTECKAENVIYTEEILCIWKPGDAQ